MRSPPQVVSANDPSAAAIQVEALRPEDSAALLMEGVRVAHESRGRGVSVAGNVTVTQRGANDLRGEIDSQAAVLRD